MQSKSSCALFDNFGNLLRYSHIFNVSLWSSLKQLLSSFFVSGSWFDDEKHENYFNTAHRRTNNESSDDHLLIFSSSISFVQLARVQGSEQRTLDTVAGGGAHSNTAPNGARVQVRAATARDVTAGQRGLHSSGDAGGELSTSTSQR